MFKKDKVIKSLLGATSVGGVVTTSSLGCVAYAQQQTVDERVAKAEKSIESFPNKVEGIIGCFNKFKEYFVAAKKNLHLMTDSVESFTWCVNDVKKQHEVV